MYGPKSKIKGRIINFFLRNTLKKHFLPELIFITLFYNTLLIFKRLLIQLTQVQLNNL